MIEYLRKLWAALFGQSRGHVAVGDRVFVLIVETRSDLTVSVHTTIEGAHKALTEYMDSYPEDAWDEDAYKSAHTYSEKVSAYYDDNETESYYLDSHPLRDLDGGGD